MSQESQQNRLRLAVQKSGRLHKRSVSLLEKAGIGFEWRENGLICPAQDFPLDLMLVRDDDIPEYVRDGVCQLGVVGYNLWHEKVLSREPGEHGAKVEQRLGFGRCRLSLAWPDSKSYRDLNDFQQTRIATSYPGSLAWFLREKEIEATIVEISGSVEIAVRLGVADAVCDLVSTGNTLRSNGLREIEPVLESEAVLLLTGHELTEGQQKTLRRLQNRFAGVMAAEKSKYVMMNAPVQAVDRIRRLLPGMEAPTIIPLQGDSERVAIHAVAPEAVFWQTMEQLKEAGAQSILVVPIEKIIA